MTTKQLGMASALAMATIFLVTVMQLRGFGTGSGPIGGLATQQMVKSENLQGLAAVLQEGCTDRDGMNQMTPNAAVATGVSYAGTLQAEDQCLNDKTVNEAYCLNGQITYKTLSCPGNTRCSSGACR